MVLRVPIDERTLACTVVANNHDEKLAFRRSDAIELPKPVFRQFLKVLCHSFEAHFFEAVLCHIQGVKSFLSLHRLVLPNHVVEDLLLLGEIHLLMLGLFQSVGGNLLREITRAVHALLHIVTIKLNH